MSDQKAQEGSESKGKNDKQEKTLRGFMAPLHAYLRKKYGRNCGFDAMTNVFNMLEQHILGNWSVEDGIQLSRSFMGKETGLTVYQVDKALKELSGKKMVHIQQVCRIKPDGKKVWEESIYRLHPDKYGVDILWIDESKPREKLQYIPGGKMIHKNVIPLGKRPEGGSLKTPHIPNDPSLKTPHNLNDQKPVDPLPVRLNTSDKSLKDPIRVSQEGSMRDFEIDKQDWSEVRGYLVEQYPGDEKQIDAIYRELQVRGVDDRGDAISCLPALMFSSYASLRKGRENPYSKPPRKVVEEPLIDEEKAAKARELAMSSLKKLWGRS